MENTHKKKPWFGFTEDVIFGEIMSNKNFCKHVLQGLVPEIEIDGNLYDFEMQHISKYKVLLCYLSLHV